MGVKRCRPKQQVRVTCASSYMKLMRPIKIFSTVQLGFQDLGPLGREQAEGCPKTLTESLKSPLSEALQVDISLAKHQV